YDSFSVLGILSRKDIYILCRSWITKQHGSALADEHVINFMIVKGFGYLLCLDWTEGLTFHQVPAAGDRSVRRSPGIRADSLCTTVDIRRLSRTNATPHRRAPVYKRN